MGREGEREGEKYEISRLSYTPQPGTEPATQACALTRNWTGDLSLCRTMPNHLSHTCQGNKFILEKQTQVSKKKTLTLPPRALAALTPEWRAFQDLLGFFIPTRRERVALFLTQRDDAVL